MAHSVLIVDDDANTREILKLLISECGANISKIFAVADAAKALEALKLMTPSLMIIDVGLPKVDGMTLIETIRKQNRLANIPIIVITAFSDTAEINLTERAERLKCSEFIHKPFDPNHILELLKKYLRKS